MRGLFTALGLSISLIACALSVRPLLPIDETRYLSVAWEMNWRADFLVAHMSGELYSHKPPLLFWLINLVWAVVGEQSWIARLVAPVAGLACLLLVFDIARKFWPSCKTTATLAPIILCATFLWTIYLPMTMFDTLVSLSLLIAIRGMQLVTSGRMLGWLVTGLGIGIGLLAKGPVILLFVVTGMFCMGLLKLKEVPRIDRTRAVVHWTLGCLGAVCLGAVIILCWAIPSAIAGGPEYASDLFLGQSTGRIIKSFAHQRPIYWYLPLVPVCLLPWIAYPPAWRLISAFRQDRLVRMLLIWMAIVFGMFSLISGKQLHYILPLIPLWSLAIARTLASATSDSCQKSHILPIALGAFASALIPWTLNNWEALANRGLAGLFYPWSALVFIAIGVATYLIPVRSVQQQATVVAGNAILWACTLLAGSQPYWSSCDFKPLANRIHEFDEPIAWYGDYQAQLNFLGRVPEITGLIDSADLQDWFQHHPSSIVVFPGPKQRRQVFPDLTTPNEMQELQITEDEKLRWESLALDRLNCLGTINADLLGVNQLNRELYIEDYFVVRISK